MNSNADSGDPKATWTTPVLRRALDRAEAENIELAHWHALFGEDALDRVKAHIAAAGAATEESGRKRLREALEEVLALDYDPAAHGNLNDWAADTIRWLDTERRLHADQVTWIHRALTEAGYSCGRGDIPNVVARLVTERAIRRGAGQ